MSIVFSLKKTNWSYCLRIKIYSSHKVKIISFASLIGRTMYFDSRSLSISELKSEKSHRTMENA